MHFIVQKIKDAMMWFKTAGFLLVWKEEIKAGHIFEITTYYVFLWAKTWKPLAF